MSDSIDNHDDWIKYLLLLENHDWSYEWTDDHAVWQRGAADFRRLKTLQIRLDPRAAVWNAKAPQQYRILPTGD